MNNKKGIFIWVFFTAFAVLLFLLGVRIAYKYGSDSFKFLLGLKSKLNISDLIAIFSAIIAIMSGMLTYVTYSSIDAVKAITNMEGNVLETENYSNVYSDIFNNVKTANNAKQYTDILGQIISKKVKINDCIGFSLHIQRFIDNVMWLNFCSKDTEIFKDSAILHEVEGKIIKLAKKAQKYQRANSGLENIFDENIKLIISIFKIHFGQDFMESDKSDKKRLHQWSNRRKYKNLKSEEKNCIVTIYNIRGQVFVNPITQITYYNYLGTKFMEDAIGKNVYQEDILSDENVQDIFNKRKIDNSRKEDFLNRAKRNLNIAKRKSAGNVLWNCICTENLLKLHIIEWIISGAPMEKKEGIYQEITDIKRKWESAHHIFTALGGVDNAANSYILNEFINRTKELDTIQNNVKEFMKQK